MITNILYIKDISECQNSLIIDHFVEATTDLILTIQKKSRDPARSWRVTSQLWALNIKIYQPNHVCHAFCSTLTVL